MFNSDKLKEFWDRTARRFGGESYKAVLFPSSRGILNWYLDFLQRSVLKKALSELRGKRVLDVGCGVGRWSSRLALTGADVIGLDLSQEMVKIAKNRTAREGFDNVDFIVASVHMLPFVSQSFDVALSVTVLQHIIGERQFREAVRELIRTTRIDGKIILLELAPHKKEDVNVQFPTACHAYGEAFTRENSMKLTTLYGVDLSLFLKPFKRIERKFGRYQDRLLGHSLPLKYRMLVFPFHFLLSLACLLSLPFDLIFRNVFMRYSNHKVFIVKRFEKTRVSECDNRGVLRDDLQN